MTLAGREEECLLEGMGGVSDCGCGAGAGGGGPLEAAAFSPAGVRCFRKRFILCSIAVYYLSLKETIRSIIEAAKSDGIPEETKSN